MIANIVGMLGSAVSSVFDWFSRITLQTGAIPLIITAIMITLVFRFLIQPFVGQASSDAVSSIKGRDPYGIKADTQISAAAREYRNSKR